MMGNDFVFTMKNKNGRRIVFGHDGLRRFVNRLPQGEIKIFDTKTMKPVGSMSASALIKKYG